MTHLIIGINSGVDGALSTIDSGGACVLRDRQFIGALAEERVTRHKYAGGYAHALQTLCAANELDLREVDAIALSFYRTTQEPSASLLELHRVALQLDARSRLVCIPSHHLSHAYSAYFLSPFERALVVVADNEGSNLYQSAQEYLERNSYYLASGNGVHLLHRDFESPGDLGFGKAYNRFTRYIGFSDYHSAGKTMGLASYSTVPRELSSIDLWKMDSDGRLISNIRDSASVKDGDEAAQLDDIRAFFSAAGIRIAPPAMRGSHMAPEYQGLAAYIQWQLNKWMCRKIEWLTKRLDTKNVCIGGGVGLNSVTNSYLEECLNVRVFTTPYASDEGQALGNAIYARLCTDPSAQMHDTARLVFTNYVRGGPDYSDARCARSAHKLFPSNEWTIEKVADVGAEVAKLLANGAVVGWFQGRSEFGARALGSRSVLADPRDGNLKVTLNERKGRELFRPFAPSVLHEQAAEFFCPSESLLFDHMLGVTYVRESVAQSIPAVVHVDRTARIQLVRRDELPSFHHLISCFYKQTGLPMVLNTSFNYAGEPIVETPDDAVRSALTLQLDALALGDYLCRRVAARPPSAGVHGATGETMSTGSIGS
jgi:carbamoyltransferase